MSLEAYVESIAHMSVPNSGLTLCGLKIDDLGHASYDWLRPRACEACLSEHARILFEKTRGARASGEEWKL